MAPALVELLGTYPHPVQVEWNIDATDANTTLLQLEELAAFVFNP